MFPHGTGSGGSSGTNSPAPGGVSSNGGGLLARTLVVGGSGRPATYGSRTLILDPTETYEEGADEGDENNEDRHVVGVLQVEGSARPERRIQWAEEVVDNEHLGKKKSKICCIFKKTREFGESSDESSSSDSDSSSDESDGGGPSLDRIPSSRNSRKSHHHDHNHGDSDEECGHHHREHEHGHIKKKKKPILNSYERMPKGNHGH